MYRIIIADDEAIECRALEMMIQSSLPELEIVPSVYNGVDLIASVEKYQPDIAIVDINMPKLNGLDALEMIRVRNGQMKIIISSAYSEFNYVKKAMKLGASDYILKPLEKDAFLDTLGKVLLTLQEERKQVCEKEDTEKHIDEMNSVVGKEFLSSLMLGEPDERSFRIYLRSLSQEYHGGILMAVRRLDTEELLQKDSYKQLMKAMEAEIGKFCSCVGKLHKDEMYFLILPGGHVTEQSIRKWISDISEILRAIGRKQGQNMLSFGVSTWKYDCEEMGAGLAECKIAVRSQGKPGIYFYESTRKQKEKHYLAGLSEKCLRWMQKGDIDRCCREIHELFSKTEIREDEAGEWQMRILEFILPLCDYMEESQEYLRRYSKKGKIDFSTLRECTDRESMESWMTESLRRLAAREQGGEKKSREYIERTIIYMEKHYMEDISLEQTAQDSGISSFYLSRLLKQELNQTFVEILTDIRMRHALQLLWKGNYTVKEIAEQSGYSNITYFYKVFKKYTGVNIGEMREYLN